MKGIREKQRLLVQLLTTKAYKDGALRDSTKLLLEERKKMHVLLGPVTSDTRARHRLMKRTLITQVHKI